MSSSADGPRAAQPPTVCAIIPAFHEAGRVGAVVQIAFASRLFARIVVVDDGSTDSTGQQAQDAGAQVVRHSQQRGKAQAMHTGLASTTEPVVCFLDADLLHVTPEHLQALVRPVLAGAEQAQLAVFSGGRLATTLAQKIAPMISGQRCLRRELLEGFAGWDSGFGVETALNAYLQQIGVEQRIVAWAGAAQVMKEEKYGVLRGGLKRLGMYADILRAWIRAHWRPG